MPSRGTARRPSTRRSIACRTTRSRSSAFALALRAHLAVVAAQVHTATVFTREWRFLDEPELTAFRGERRRYEERWRSLLREAAERGALRADLDGEATVLLVLSAANWAYTWIRPETDTDALADRFFAILVDGVRGYATRPA